MDGEQVHAHAAGCREAFAAGGTGEGFVLQVHVAVSRQVGASGERLAGALTRQSVLPQATRSRQRLSAG